MRFSASAIWKLRQCQSAQSDGLDSRYIIKTDSDEYIAWNVRNCLYKSQDYLKRNTVSFRKGNTEITIVQVDEPTDMKSVTAVCSTATRITIYSTILDVKEILSKEDSE